MKALAHLIIGLVFLALCFLFAYGASQPGGHWYEYITAAVAGFLAFRYFELIESD